MRATVRRVDISNEADPFDSVPTPFSVLLPPPRPRANTAPANAAPSRGLELLTRIRQANETSSPAPGAPAAPAPHTPHVMPPSSTTHSVPEAPPPTTGAALMRMMQTNMARLEQQQQQPPTTSKPPAPKRTTFVPGSTTTSTGSSVSLKGVQELRSCLTATTAANGRCLVALTVLSVDGASTFDAGTGIRSIEDAVPRAADQIGLVLASLDSIAYSFGKGQAGCDELRRLILDDAFESVEYCGFGLSTTYQGLFAGAGPGGTSGFETRRFTDVRTMAWMLRPDQPVMTFDEMVAIHADRLPGLQRTSLAVRSLEGIASRLASVPHVVRGFQRTLAEQGMMAAFAAVERPLGMLLAAMKYHGFAVDTAEVADLSKDVSNQMSAAKVQANAVIAGRVDFGPGGFNIQSPEHCRKVLFDVLGLDKCISAADLPTTGAGRLSTSEEVLRLLEPHHPLPGIILEYRKIAKLQQTYFEGVFSRARISHDGIPRVHATFLQEATDTGRLSCADPNLQNLPRSSTELLGSVRRGFVAPPGYELVAFDYEQIELRVLAHLCGDEVMRTALRSSNKHESDIHRRIASRIFGKPFDQISSEERTAAKRVVFGVTYGMGPKALATQLSIAFDEARRIMSEFKRSFPTVERFIDQVHQDCRRVGSVRTILNRVRFLPEINEMSAQRRSLAERQAFNTVIQGSAADIVKKAMVDTNRLIVSNQLSAVLLCQVHDELIFAVPSINVAREAALLGSCMEDCMTLSVPLVVKATRGFSLGTMGPLVMPQ